LPCLRPGHMGRRQGSARCGARQVVWRKWGGAQPNVTLVESRPTTQIGSRRCRPNRHRSCARIVPRNFPRQQRCARREASGVERRNGETATCRPVYHARGSAWRPLRHNRRQEGHTTMVRGASAASGVRSGVHVHNRPVKRSTRMSVRVAVKKYVTTRNFS